MFYFNKIDKVVLSDFLQYYQKILLLYSTFFSRIDSNKQTKNSRSYFVKDTAYCIPLYFLIHQNIFALHRFSFFKRLGLGRIYCNVNECNGKCWIGECYEIVTSNITFSSPTATKHLGRRTFFNQKGIE